MKKIVSSLCFALLAGAAQAAYAEQQARRPGLSRDRGALPQGKRLARNAQPQDQARRQRRLGHRRDAGERDFGGGIGRPRALDTLALSARRIVDRRYPRALPGFPPPRQRSPHR